MNLRLNDFELKDRPLFESRFKSFRASSCEYNFPNLFCWRDVYQNKWAEHNGRLVVFSGKLDEFLMPVGPETSVAELLEISDFLIGQGRGGNLSQVSEEYVARHPEILEHFTAETRPERAEYIYSAEKLTLLKGEKLRKKRNLISQFKRACPDYRCEPLDAKTLPLCFDLAGKWCMDKTCAMRSMRHENFALKEAVDNFAPLGLEGLLIYACGETVAFSMFSPINNDLYDIHFEKTDMSVKGAAQAINWETAKFLRGKCSRLNREQDLGLPGLRQAKLSYEPSMILNDLVLTRKR